MRARGNIENVTKQTVDQLNTRAIQKVKNEKLAQKAAKEIDEIKKMKQEKIDEKKKGYKQRKDNEMSDLLKAGVDSYKHHKEEVKETIKKKEHDEKEKAAKVFSQMQDFTGHAGAQSNIDGRSQMSKTQNSGFWANNK